MKAISHLEYFSRLFSTSFVDRVTEPEPINQKFVQKFTHDKTHFSSFLFGYHKDPGSVSTVEGAMELKLNVRGTKKIQSAVEEARQELFDYEMHCTGPVFRSGNYEACESMWLIVQLNHWMRLQVHGINLLQMASRKAEDPPSSLKIDSWTSYYNHDMLSMQAFDEIIPIEYRRDDISSIVGSSSRGIMTVLLKEFMSSHEIIPISFYTVHYLTHHERNQKRAQHHPKYFIPIVFNETGKGEYGGYFTEDVEFAVPFKSPVKGLASAMEQYTDFMKNVERVFMYLEGPIHLQPSTDQNVIKASVALSYMIYTKEDYPNKHVLCQGIAFLEVDRRKSTKQFSSFKYLFNDDDILVALGNKSNVRVISSFGKN